MTTKFFLSVTGTEQVWDGKRWKRVGTGHNLAAILGPVLKTVYTLSESTEPTEEKRKRFREVIDAALPSGEFINLTDKHLFLESLAAAFFCIWPYDNQYYTAKQAFEDYERSQFLEMEPRKGRVFPALPYLQGSWRKSDIYPHIKIGRKASRLGWMVEAPTPWDAAACEAMLMVIHNVRNKLNLCPKCCTFHWGENHHICRECRREKERLKKAAPEEVAKRGTPEYRFRNLLSQDKNRRKLTREQVERLKVILKNQGVKAAEVEREKILKECRQPLPQLH
ncbi:MAG: hypothetical protein AB1374_07585 [Bacillota bacterium]